MEIKKKILLILIKILLEQNVLGKNGRQKKVIMYVRKLNRIHVMEIIPLLMVLKIKLKKITMLLKRQLKERWKLLLLLIRVLKQN